MFDGLDRLHIKSPNLVVCFFTIDQREEVWFSLTHTHSLSIFSHSKSTHYSLTMWKGRKGKMIIKSCDYDRETFASNWCVSAETHSERMMNHSWRTWERLLSPSLIFIFTLRSYKQASGPSIHSKPKHSDQHILTFCNARSATVAFFHSVIKLFQPKTCLRQHFCKQLTLLLACFATLLEYAMIDAKVSKTFQQCFITVVVTNIIAVWKWNVQCVAQKG